MVEQIKITYRDGAYRVNRPEWDGGDVVMATDYAALKAENERLKLSVSAWEDSARINKDRADEAERALAERAGGAKVLRDLLAYVDQNTCPHEATHRGGTIWTICDDCGKQWADDRGGFVPHEDAKPVATAREYLRALTTEPAAPEGRQEAVAWQPTLAEELAERYKRQMIDTEREAFQAAQVGDKARQSIASTESERHRAVYHAMCLILDDHRKAMPA